MSKTFISSDMSVEGDISSQSDIEVDGKVKGNSLVRRYLFYHLAR